MSEKNHIEPSDRVKLYAYVAALKAENERLREWIKEEADYYDLCSFNVLGEVCDGCRCERAKKP